MTTNNLFNIVRNFVVSSRGMRIIVTVAVFVLVIAMLLAPSVITLADRLGTGG